MNIFDRWGGFEVLQVNQWIVAQQDIRSQDSVRIKEVLYTPHQVGKFVAPFAPDKGSHVDSRSVLRLQRAVILIHHHLDKVPHETVVLLPARVFAQSCNHHEMQVSVSSVPRGGRWISVFSKKTEQITRSIRKMCGRETDVFDDETCALRTHLTDDAEKTITDVPCKLNCFGVKNEFHRPQHFHIA